MKRSKTRERVKTNQNVFHKRIRLFGIMLIIGGLALIGYTGVQKAAVAYNQRQLMKAYESSLFELPPTGDTYRRVIITEQLPMRLIIPIINVDLAVVYGDLVNYVSEEERDRLLDKGPVHFEISHLPGTEPGNVAIAGHRAGRWNFFLDLDRLVEGDEIYLDVGGYRFIYLVQWDKIVEPTDWSAIKDPTAYPALTLQTCHPKNVRATHRLIVRAALDEVVRVPEQ